MANVVKKNVQKGTENTIIVAVAGAIGVIVAKLAKDNGIDIDSTVVAAGVTTILSGLAAALKNWWDHRDTKKVSA